MAGQPNSQRYEAQVKPLKLVLLKISVAFVIMLAVALFIISYVMGLAMGGQ